MSEKRKILDSYSESEIEEAFLASFAETAAFNYINSYEIEVERDYDDGQRMKITVEVGAMAGTPTRHEFDSVKDMNEFELTFVTGAKATVVVDEVVDYNAMEYHVIYAEGEPSLPVDAPEVKEDTNTLAGSE